MRGQSSLTISATLHSSEYVLEVFPNAPMVRTDMLGQAHRLEDQQSLAHMLLRQPRNAVDETPIRVRQYRERSRGPIVGRHSISLDRSVKWSVPLFMNLPTLGGGGVPL